jgi:hypothetical protein
MKHHELAIRFHPARRGRTLAVVRTVQDDLVRWTRHLLPVRPEVVATCAAVVNHARRCQGPLE